MNSKSSSGSESPLTLLRGSAIAKCAANVNAVEVDSDSSKGEKEAVL